MSSDNLEDCEDRQKRREDRKDNRHDRRDRLMKNRGCIFGTISLGFVIVMAVCSGVLNWMGCRPGIFRQDGTEQLEQVLEDEANAFMSTDKPEGGLGGTPSAPVLQRSEHVKTEDGQMLRSTSRGRGLVIDWRSIERPTGASLESVLDAALSRAQSLQQTPQGGDELARVIFQLDKTMEELRSSGFQEGGSLRGSGDDGAGFKKPEGDTSKSGPGFGATQE